mmetsp:Transcript_1849/g.2768  ORF Transcript_1849/g.2768 Transcript_1849/m.2768 type:complete len:164 (+) Transcript_1849:44-535(+)|eukprot:CAMPEP_0197232418 /NCGR_PEP_ID=MMETSP1429-20130617/620_1 /TAXON_ID=49237 /ORGANISM="Chaetoceros  sp., Strain UNC1202" /LENGTH=163 /DNA_ID=CAMNT_0042690425 /DNA_START=44 /DNA_END=535 /DNA_ORIENTATION=-
MPSIKAFRTITALFLYILLAISTDTNSQAMASDTRDLRVRGLLGGYEKKRDPEEDEEVIEAARTVVDSLKENMDLLEKYRYSFDLPKGDDGNYNVKIIEASKQVVAGMNYKLTFGIFVGPDCRGGLSAVVNRDLQHNFKVTSYGKEISCKTVKQMIEDEKDEE